MGRKAGTDDVSKYFYNKPGAGGQGRDGHIRRVYVGQHVERPRDFPCCCWRSALNQTVRDEGRFMPATSLLVQEVELWKKSHQEGQTLTLCLSEYIVVIHTKLPVLLRVELPQTNLRTFPCHLGCKLSTLNLTRFIFPVSETQQMVVFPPVWMTGD